MTRTLSLLLPLLILTAGILSAQPGSTESLGTVKPVYTYEKSVIAVPAFGRDEAPVTFEALPRIIRRDLALSGFFSMPADQNRVNGANMHDVRNRTVSFAAWQGMGVEYYLMASLSVPEPGVLRAMVLLYDIPSQTLLFRRNIDGSVEDPRMLAHRISDEVVRFTKNCQGIAQTKLVYISEQVRNIKEVAIIDADSFNPTPLTRFNNLCTTPAWGMNGTEVYYTSYAGNRAIVYGQRLSDGANWKIAAYGGTNHSPAWCDANQRLVMTLSRDGNSELYTSKRDGSDLRRITKTKATEGSPCWSPDGSKIAYVSNEGGPFAIWIANPDGSGARRLINKGGWIDSPSWSPDGQKIVFVYRQGGVNDIYTIRADGDMSTVRRLTMNQGNNESPVWAPNSRHIAFSSDRSSQRHIYIMLDDGSNQQILTTSGRNTEPAWGPAPVVR